jgi:hypothetical protein
MSSGTALDPERSLRLLAVWALLLNRPELVRMMEDLYNFEFSKKMPAVSNLKEIIHNL